MDEEEHEFGGAWTQRKLSALSDYLQFYTSALKNQPFKKLYVDAFAGTGTVRATSDDDPMGEPERKLLAGSAKIAIDLDVPFDRYVFIDADRVHAASLGKLADANPTLSVDVYHADANELLRELAGSEDWNSSRAVVFLDPYGAQIEWATLTALAETQAVDVWLLVPFGMAYTRMMPRSGEVPDGWESRLTRAFGTDEWRDAAYEEVPSTIDMFTGEEVQKRRRKLEDIERWFVERLRSVFPGVAGPIYLENSSGTWLYSLFFAVANPTPKARGLAMKGAQHIVDKFGDHRGSK